MTSLPSVDALTAALVLRSADSSRNRNFAIHATREGARARRRAARIRGIVRQIAGAFGPARDVHIGNDGDEVILTYCLARVSMVREARLGTLDLAILRVALAARGTRLLPAALLARSDDHARVGALLDEFSRARVASADTP